MKHTYSVEYSVLNEYICKCKQMEGSLEKSVERYKMLLCVVGVRYCTIASAIVVGRVWYFGTGVCTIVGKCGGL